MFALLRGERGCEDAFSALWARGQTSVGGPAWLLGVSRAARGPARIGSARSTGGARRARGLTERPFRVPAAGRRCGRPGLADERSPHACRPRAGPLPIRPTHLVSCFLTTRCSFLRVGLALTGTRWPYFIRLWDEDAPVSKPLGFKTKLQYNVQAMESRSKYRGQLFRYTLQYEDKIKPRMLHREVTCIYYLWAGHCCQISNSFIFTSLDFSTRKLQRILRKYLFHIFRRGPNQFWVT